MTVERAGIVHLLDLAYRAAWERSALEPFLADHDLVPEGPLTRRFVPPRILVVVAPWDAPWRLASHRAWLTAAERVLVVRLDSDGADLALDPGRAAVVEDEWRAIDFPFTLVERFDEALALAASLARQLPPRVASERSVSPPDELPISGWNAVPPARYDWAFLERITRQASEIAIGPAADLPWSTPEEARVWQNRQPGTRGLGADPIHPVRWRGDRMRIHWYFGPRVEGGFFCADDHDYPCGPGKKLYGYLDNDPVQVVLAPDATQYAARYEHDLVVTRNVPLPWQRAGAFDVAVRPTDPYRALFYAQDPANDEKAPRPDDIHDEDGRDLAPALVLMPGGYAVDLRYRVYRITNGPTGRESATRAHVGGPAEGIAIFDAEHRLVRRAAGVLLGGWYRFATIEDDGAYWREDLVTGERTRLAPVDLTMSDDPAVESVARDAVLEGRHEAARAARGPARTMTIDCVLALPGTKNVLLVSEQHVRVI